MKKVTYICDRCKKSAEDNSLDLKEIKLLMPNDYHHSPKFRVDWCNECCEETGLTEIWIKGVEKASSKPMLPGDAIEEVLREIVRDEIEASRQN